MRILKVTPVTQCYVVLKILDFTSFTRANNPLFFAYVSLLCVFTLCSIELSGQNLVLNGGFENYSALPDEVAQWYNCENWNNVSHGLFYPSATPDYFHRSGANQARLPEAFIATLEPHSGQAIMGILAYGDFLPDFREYISIRLSEPLIPGLPYQASFWVTNGMFDQGMRYSCNGMGYLLTTNSPVQRTHEPILAATHRTNSQLWSTDWVNITDTIVADSAYEFLTIGNFLDDASIEVARQLQGGSASVGVYYFIDDVEVLPVLTYPEITGDEMICKGDSAVLIGSTIGQYRWANSANPAVVLSTDSSLVVAPDSTSTYLLFGTGDTASFTVEVIDWQGFEISNEQELCIGDTLQLQTNYPGGQLLWQDGSSDTSFLVTEGGVYWTILSVEHCEFSDSVTVQATECQECILFLPNSFTPNNDGTNDTYHLNTFCNFSVYHIQIYDRWGQLVFESNNPIQAWDGSKGNSPLPVGQYVVQLNYRFEGESEPKGLLHPLYLIR